MHSEQVWWNLKSEAHIPAARWLGIFRRAVSLNAASPNRLSVPALREVPPQTLAFDKSPSTRASVLQGVVLMSAATSVLISDLTLAAKMTGSVSLAGVSPDEASLSPKTTRDTPEDRLWNRLNSELAATLPQMRGFR